jgi:transcriptional regulator with XRE-family HTH domain
MNIFLQNLKEEMSYQDITQKELADRTGISINTIRGWFSKDLTPDVFTAAKLAKALNTTMEFLVTGTAAKNVVSTPLEIKLLELFRRIPDDPHRELVISLEEKLLVI